MWCISLTDVKTAFVGCKDAKDWNVEEKTPDETDEGKKQKQFSQFYINLKNVQIQ